MVASVWVFSVALGLIVFTVPGAPGSEQVKIKFKTIHVDSQGMSRDDMDDRTYTPEVCKKLYLSDSQARKWFRAAKQVSRQYWFHELYWTPCYVAGHLETSDGLNHEWHIDCSGRGIIIFPGEESVYLSGKELALEP